MGKGQLGCVRLAKQALEAGEVEQGKVERIWAVGSRRAGMGSMVGVVRVKGAGLGEMMRGWS